VPQILAANSKGIILKLSPADDTRDFTP